MDLFLLLTSSLFFVPVLLIFFYKPKANNYKKLPPGKTGWPIIGETFELVSAGKSGHPDVFFKKRMEKYSPEIFKSSIAGEKVAVLCGPSGNKFLFSNENKLVGSWIPWSILKIFPVDVVTSKNGLKMMYQSFKAEAIKNYIPTIDSSTISHLKREWVSREVKVFPLSEKLTFSLACKLLISSEDHSFVTEFANEFNKLIAGILSIPVNLPGTTFNRAIKAANLIADRLVPIIKERKRLVDEKSISASHDLLSKFVTWTDEDGKFFDEIEIANIIMGLLLASHSNTSTLFTFVVYYLADHPHVHAKVVEEQVEILKSKQEGELLNWDDIQKMKYSRNVTSEVLRLQPIVPGFFRQAITDFTYANFSIPKGWKTFWSVHTTHKDPKYFEDPEKFDPTRFEGKGPMPYTFVPFGGGPSMCPGGEYARAMVLVFMHRFVTKFKFDKIIPNESIVYAPSPVPVHGLPVTLSPRQT